MLRTKKLSPELAENSTDWFLTEVARRLDRDDGIAAYASNPVGFVRDILGGDPWARQEEILLSVRDNRRTAVRSCHGIGKTRVAAWAVLWFLLTQTNSVAVTTAPTFHQVEQLLWREIRAAAAGSKHPLPGKALNVRYEVADSWYAIGISTDKPERFQGFHAASGNILLVCDEASGIEQPIYDASEGFLTSEGAKLLLIGNPTQTTGEFYNAFRSDLYHTIHISAWDSPNLQAGEVVRPYLITPAWVDEKRQQWGEDSPLWFSRVRGDFPEQGEDTLIPLAWIEAAQARYCEVQPGEPNRLGVDVARFGSDESAIYHRQGIIGKLYANMRKIDTMAVTGQVLAALQQTGAECANVDEIGIGAGVVDRAKEQGAKVNGINVAASPQDKERFVLARDEWAWMLRERFRDGQIAIDPADDILAAQLSSIRYAYDSRGRVKIESKADMKKRGLPSPDRADGLMLAFIEPVKRESPIVFL